MTTTTNTFGPVTLTWVRTDYSGVYGLRASAEGQRTTQAETRPGKDGGWFCGLTTRWTRPDGTFSPGFKITAEAMTALWAEHAALNKAADDRYEASMAFANNAQIWD